MQARYFRLALGPLLFILTLVLLACKLPPNSPQDHPYRYMPEPANNYG